MGIIGHTVSTHILGGSSSVLYPIRVGMIHFASAADFQTILDL